MDTNIPVLPRVERKQYKNSFLYCVTFTCTFAEPLSKDSIAALYDFLQQDGWRKVVDPTDSTVTFEKYDAAAKVTPSSQFILLIGKECYEKFDKWVTWLSRFEQALCDAQIKTFIIYKSNHLRVKKDHYQGEKWMAEQLLSKPYLDAYSKVLPNAVIVKPSGNIRPISNYNIMPGYKDVTLRLTIMSITDNVTNFTEDLRKTNDELFCLWYWAVSEDVIKMMEE